MAKFKVWILAATVIFAAGGCGPGKDEGPRLADPSQEDPRLKPVGAGPADPAPVKNKGIQLKGNAGQ